MKFRCIDFETTGLPGNDGVNNHGLVEIGWTDLVDGVISEPVSFLTNPGRAIELQAVAVHHIRDCDLISAPSPDRVLIKLQDTKPDFFVAHNVDFEKKFYSGGEIPWICTYKTALRVFKDADLHTNQFLRYLLSVDDDPDFDRELAARPHRAPDDSYVTAFLLRRILAEAKRQGVDIAKLAAWSKMPALLSKVTFGKHAMTKWSEVPLSYLKWIVDKSDFDDRDVLATARYYIKAHESKDQTSTQANMKI